MPGDDAVAELPLRPAPEALSELRCCLPDRLLPLLSLPSPLLLLSRGTALVDAWGLTAPLSSPATTELSANRTLVDGALQLILFGAGITAVVVAVQLVKEGVVVVQWAGLPRSPELPLEVVAGTWLRRERSEGTDVVACWSFDESACLRRI